MEIDNDFDTCTSIVRNLFVSSRTVATSKKMLAKFDIRYILTIHQSPLDEHFKGIEYKFIFADDEGNTLYHKRLADFYQEIVEWIDKNRKNGNVLIHCQQGRNRSISAILVYLAYRYQLPLEKSMEYVDKKRTICLDAEIEKDLKIWISNFVSNKL